MGLEDHHESERDIGPIIEMNEDILKDNLELATRNQKLFHRHGVKTFDIVGAIGSGKTALLERIAEHYATRRRMFVICGDVTTTIDSDRIRVHGARTFQINTGRECALNAYHIQTVLKADPSILTETDVLFIENVGNLICPADFVLGSDKRILIVSVTEGDHVIIKHPLLVKMSAAIIINKIDLVSVLGTNLQRMVDDAKAINPIIDVFTVSAKTGENLEKLYAYLDL